MPEPYQWQSALASQAIEARALSVASEAGVVLCERPPGTQLVVRGNASAGDFNARVARVLGVELPVTANTAHRNAGNTLLWLGPDEWLAAAPAGAGADLAVRLEQALDTLHHAVVDVSHSRTVMGLTGARARDVLMKGTNVDLHARRFASDNCIQARLGRCHMLLHQLDDMPSYDIYVHRSFAVYAWSWLSDAGAEYGLAVRGAKPEKP